MYKCFLSNRKNQAGAVMAGESMMAKIGVLRLQWFHSQVRGPLKQAAELAQLRDQQGGGKYSSKI